MLLKEPIRVNSLLLANRLVMPPMFTGKTPEGKVTPELCEYYRRRAGDGAVGLTIVEYSYISRQGQAKETQVSMMDDSDVPGQRQLVSAVHSGGSRAFAQINHAGSLTSSDITGEEVVGPSAVANPIRMQSVRSLPRALEKEEILEIQEQFTRAALRAAEAGFDGVEIHSAHGYLLNQFYSPLTNRREDEYGGQSVENRTRFAAETLKKVRRALGPDYPVSIRLGGCDYVSGGSTIEDCAEACALFEKAGADFVDITGGMSGYILPDRKYAGYFSDMSEPVKRAVSVPVMLTGGVNTAAEAEELLKAGCADMIGVGRAIFKDADWAKNAMA